MLTCPRESFFLGENNWRERERAYVFGWGHTGGTLWYVYIYICVQQDDLEMKQYTPSDGRHEEEPKDFEIGVHIQNLTKVYSKV